MASNFNIRKEFLGTSTAWRDQGVFNTALDEPTYLTFRVKFFSDEWYTDNSYFYDTIPQALFSIGDQHNNKVCMDLDLWKPELDDVTTFINSFKGDKLQASGFISDRAYSALEYLYSRNEDYRCYMLAKFLKGWNDLQTKYQYYFQEISGLDELFKSDPSKGQKIEKSHTITIKCLEGIDQKVKYLYSLYKAAAWDDHYQRWILPDIYRYFKLDIFISEIRTFHQSAYADPIDPNGRYSKSLLSSLYSDNGPFAKAIDRFAGKIVDKITGKVFSTLDDWTEGGVNIGRKEDNFVLGVVSGFTPVTCIRCSLCDFDINHNVFAGEYTANNDQMETTTIKVRVRNAEIMHNWQYIEPYRNLLSHTDRTIGQNTLKSLVDIGANADQVFNNTFYLVDDDKIHDHTGTITAGWVMDTLGKIVDSVSTDGNKLLDIVYNGYESIRDGIAAKDAVEGNYQDSRATHSNIYDIETRDHHDRSLATSLDSHTENMTEVEWDDSKRDLMTGTMGPSSNPATSMTSIEGEEFKSNVINEEQEAARQRILDVLKSDGTYPYIRARAEDILRHHASDLQNNIQYQVARQQTELESSELYKDLIDKISYLQSVSVTSMATVDSKLKTTVDTNVSQSLSTSPDNKIEGEPEKIDRSFSTDLDNSVGWDSSMRDYMHYMSQAKDKSTATDMDNQYPDTWSLEQMRNMDSIPQGRDRSEATGLDNARAWESQKQSVMQNVHQPEDWSDATDLDGQTIDPAMTDAPQTSTISSATYVIDYNKAFLPTPITPDVFASFATGDPSNNDWSTQARRSMNDVAQPEDRSSATDLDNQVTWEPDQKKTMQLVVDSSSWSNATGEGFDPEWALVTMRYLPHLASGNQENSLATVNPWANGVSYFMQDLNVDDDYDYSIATDLGNIWSWPETQRNQMKWIDTGDDRSVATDLDNETVLWTKFARASMYPGGVEEDRSVSTDLDNLWTWETNVIEELTWTPEKPLASTSTEQEEGYKTMTDNTKIIDRSESTNLDNLEGVWDIQRYMEMYSPKQGNDRSIATDLDEIPSTKPMDELQRKTEEVQKTFEESTIGNESLRDKMTQPYSTSMFEHIASEMASVRGGEKTEVTSIENPILPQTTDSMSDTSVAMTYLSDRAEGQLENNLYDSMQTSLFESIATSASMDLTAVDQTTKPAGEILDIRPESKSTSKYDKILMEDGTISGSTPLTDLIEVYIEDKTQKMELQEVSPKDYNNYKPKTVL